MLKIFDNKKTESFVLRNIDNLYCESSEGGNKTVCFDISPKDEQYNLLAEEIRLEYKNLYYLVKKINERKTVSSITAELDLDELKKNAYFEYNQSEISLNNLLLNCLNGTGWTATNAALISHNHTLELNNVNTLDIINKASELWGCAFNFDNKNKVIDCIDLEIIQPSGVYFTDELNLKSIEFKGDSSDFCTRLRCRGAKDDEGNYLTFESINDNKDYVENFDYSDKIITKTWIDERYTDKQSLKDDAVEKLKLLAIPSRSYNCTLIDLSKVDNKYADMGINLYDKVILVDRKRKTRVLHRVVKLKEYEKNALNNVFTLSSIQSSLTGTITTVKTLLDNAGDIAVDGKSLNEFKRDINTNSLEISKRYTKGETETLVSSAITQSESDITLDFKNGGLSTNVIFDTNGEKIYNGNFEIYDKPKADSTAKKIFGVDTDGIFFFNGKITADSELSVANGSIVDFSNYTYTQEDLTEVRNILLNKTEPTELQLSKYDLNTDGRISVSDMSSIQLILLNLVNKPKYTYELKLNKDENLLVINQIDLANGNSTREKMRFTIRDSYINTLRSDDICLKQLTAIPTGSNISGDWTSESFIAKTSDFNKKNTISAIDDKYNDFFDNLQPVTYKYKDNTSNRLHSGFISQWTEQALLEADLTTEEWGGFVRDKDSNYYLRYEEFISLNTWQIQKLKAKINTQQAQINNLQAQIDELKSLINQNN